MNDHTNSTNTPKANDRKIAPYPISIYIIGGIWMALAVTTLALHYSPYGERLSLSYLLKPIESPDPWSRQRAVISMMSLTPHGCLPEEVSVPAGKVLFTVNNGLGVDDLKLRIGREGDNQPVNTVRFHSTVADSTEAAVRMGATENQLAYHGLAELTDGTYLLRDANHMGSACRITVVP